VSLVEGFPELLHCECNFLGSLVNAAGRSKILAVTVSDAGALRRELGAVLSPAEVAALVAALPPVRPR
jgi:hypothetical protein